MLRKVPSLCLVLFVLFPFRLAVSDECDDTSYQKIEKGVVAYLKKENAKLSERKMRAIARHVCRESSRRRVDYRLILAVMKVESNFKENAVSSKGAVGLLQIKPSTGKTVAKSIGMKWGGKSQLHEPGKNIMIGVSHLASLIKDFSNLSMALNAYNRGAKGVRAHKQGPNARYAKAVMKEYAKAVSLLPDPPP